jgi:hypothetical protein
MSQVLLLSAAKLKRIQGLAVIPPMTVPHHASRLGLQKLYTTRQLTLDDRTRFHQEPIFLKKKNVLSCAAANQFPTRTPHTYIAIDNNGLKTEVGCPRYLVGDRLLQHNPSLCSHFEQPVFNV